MIYEQQTALDLHRTLSDNGWAGNEAEFLEEMHKRLSYAGFDPLAVRALLNEKAEKSVLHAFKMLSFYVGKRGTNIRKSPNSVDPTFAGKVVAAQRLLPGEWKISNLGRLTAVFPEYSLAGRLGGQLDVRESALNFAWLSEVERRPAWVAAIEHNLRLTQREAQIPRTRQLVDVVMAPGAKWLTVIDTPILNLAVASIRAGPVVGNTVLASDEDLIRRINRDIHGGVLQSLEHYASNSLNPTVIRDHYWNSLEDFVSDGGADQLKMQASMQTAITTMEARIRRREERLEQHRALAERAATGSEVSVPTPFEHEASSSQHSAKPAAAGATPDVKKAGKK